MLKNAAICFDQVGLRPAGFRSPRSDWSVPLLRALAAHGYRWNAERDPAGGPYRLMGGLVRVPVATDDWDLVADPSALPGLMLKWRQQVESALARRRVVCLGLHEWLLGMHPAFVEALDGFLAALRPADVLSVQPLSGLVLPT